MEFRSTTCWLKIFLIASLSTLVVGSPKNVIYWGQESDGSENSLRSYCTGSYDVIVIGFVYLFPTASGSSYPGMNFAGHCSNTFNNQNPLLLDCSDTIGPDITYCQSQGVQILISLGGGEGTYSLSSTSVAQAFATTIWDMYLGGSSSVRTFGTAILDGVDLDIEHGGSGDYAAFIDQSRTSFATASKPYYISGAPQCPYPDEEMGPSSGAALGNAWFDYVWVQFYNNYCGLDAYPSQFNFDTWGNWARTQSINPNTKIFIGAPAGPNAAGTGYVSLSELTTIVNAIYSEYSDVFGGVMMWDCSNSDNNGNFGGQVGTLIHSLSTSGSTPTPPPTPPAPSPPTPTPPVGRLTTSAVQHSATTAKAPKSLTTHKLTTHKLAAQKLTTHKAQHSSTTTSTTGTTGTTGNTGTTGTTGTGGTGQSVNSPGCTTIGFEECFASGYHTCENGLVWSGMQSCQSGLSCHQSGNYVYCY